jgi:ATP-dependent helicase/nuclease subunit B
MHEAPPSFIQECAREIAGSHGKELAEVTIVVPGKRAGLFLRKALRENLDGPFFAPRILTLPSFFEWCTGHVTATRTLLLFRLYEAYSRLNTDREGFAQFLKWGAMCLDDFSDLDHALVNPADFFRELKDIRDIENWSFSAEPLSESQEQYRKFWLTLGPLYREFITADGPPGYAGLVRGIAEKRIEKRPDRKESHSWLLGLSSLTRAETMATDMLTSEAGATYRWDVDAWYVGEKGHSAGTFFTTRLMRDTLSPPSHFQETERSIHVHQCTTATGEMWALQERLAEMTADQLRKAVVVVMDEQTVHPFLQGLPELPVKINVAMGLALRHEPLFRLMRDLLHLHAQYTGHEKRGIYHAHFTRVASNPLFPLLTGISGSRIQQWIRKGSLIRITGAHFAELVQRYPGSEAFITQWLAAPLNPADWLKQARSFVLSLYEEQHDAMLHETALRMHQLLHQITGYADTYEWLSSYEDLEAVFRSLVARETVAYSGEPLEGLQVLSMVETRAIDFEYVMIVGANEDLLPGGGLYQSLVPFDLRRYHGMTLPSDREATYAYTFYRLIQRSMRADLYYAGIVADFRGSEQSRYITQLELELPMRDTRSALFKHRVVSPPGKLPDQSEAFMRSGFSDERIKAWMERGISPSSIGSFLRCPKDFYYKYVLGVGETEELEEQISVSVFGTVVHKVMEHFLRAFEGSYPEADDWNELRASLHERILEAAREAAPGQRLDTGFNLIQLEVMEDMLKRLIRFEEEAHDTLGKTGKTHIIRKAEEDLSAELPDHIHGFGHPVRLRGKADRVDEIGNGVLIIDYKSGKIKADEVSPGKSTEDWFSGKKNKLIQVLSYAYMYCSNGHDPKRVNAGLLSLVDLDAGLHSLEGLKEEFPQWKEIFERELCAFLGRVRNLEQFEHNPDSNHCELCNPA